jgi:hypothetical protein
MTGYQSETNLAGNEALRPLRDLVLLLPHMQARGIGRGEFQIDWASAEPALLRQISTNADITMRTVNRGVAAIGRLIVAISPEVGTGEIPADNIEALGWLLAEISDLAATAHQIAAACNRYTSDYAPDKPTYIPTARP